MGEGIMIDFRLVYSDYSYRRNANERKEILSTRKQLNSEHTSYILNAAAKMVAISQIGFAAERELTELPEQSNSSAPQARAGLLTFRQRHQTAVGLLLGSPRRIFEGPNSRR